MNFISKFIEEKILVDTEKKTSKTLDKRIKNEKDVVFLKKIKEVTNKNDEEFNKSIESLSVVKKDTQQVLNKKIPTERISKKIKNNIPNYAKELAGYLQNDTNLDLSLLKMTNNLIQEKENKTVIKIKKEASYKSLKWILAQFIIWLALIFFTMNYVQSQPAEKKFLESSVQLWINTFQKLIGHFGWVFTKDVDKIYLQKKENLLNQLIGDEKKVLDCLSKEKDESKQRYLNKLYMKIKLFEQQLSNPEYTPLNQFIKNYDQYNLYVYSLNEAVNKECKANK